MADKTEDLLPFDEVERGKYISNLEDYQGYIKLPAPLQGRHYKAYQKELVEDGADPMWIEWRAALAIVEEWNINGLKPSDLTPDGDNVPLEIVQWVRMVFLVYLNDAVSLKNLRAPSQTT